MRISDWSSDVCSSDLCYRGLGLSPADLDRHIAWDIGAAALTRRLAEMLDAPAFLGAYSRLLIDLNRPLDIPGSIPVRSEATIVPGNDALSREEREGRRDRIRSEEHTSELQSLMRISYAVFCLKNKQHN